jgi:hypothetical protein
MPIQKITRLDGTAYKVQIRRRGFPSAFRTFSRYSDARAFEERILREQEVRAAYGCNVNLTLAEAIDAYTASDDYASLRSDRSAYHAHWKRRLGDRKLGSLHRAVYQGEAEQLAQAGRSRATVATFMSALGTELKYATRKMAADARALAEFRCCPFSAQSAVRGRALETDEMRRLIAAADGRIVATLGPVGASGAQHGRSQGGAFEATPARRRPPAPSPYPCRRTAMQGVRPPSLSEPGQVEARFSQGPSKSPMPFHLHTPTPRTPEQRAERRDEYERHNGTVLRPVDPDYIEAISVARPELVAAGELALRAVANVYLLAATPARRHRRHKGCFWLHNL